MTRALLWLPAGLLAAVVAAGPASAAPKTDEFTAEFPISDCQFTGSSDNRYFSLHAGDQLFLSNFRCVDAGDCDELEEVVITVLPDTRTIELEIDGEMLSLHARVVEESETADGELVEVSRNFFAECNGTEDVYYFGEDVDDYEDGVIVGHGGAWLAGEDGAGAGIIMPGGAFLLGARYFQEIAPAVAMDRAEHVDMGLEVDVPAGTFEDCVEIEETTPLEAKELSTKIYCPGVGLVVDDDLELVDWF